MPLSARVALGDVSGLERRLHLLRERQQPQGVCDRRAALPHPFGDLLLSQPVQLHQVAVGARRLERGKILALKVLDQCELGGLTVVDVEHHHRDLAETRHFGGAPAAFAGDDRIEPVVRVPDDHRLYHAVLRDRGRQLGQRRLVEPLARLILSRLDVGDAHHPRRARALYAVVLEDRVHSAAQTL